MKRKTLGEPPRSRKLEPLTSCRERRQCLKENKSSVFVFISKTSVKREAGRILISCAHY